MLCFLIVNKRGRYYIAAIRTNHHLEFAGIGMLQRVNVYAAAGLCLTLPDGVGNGSGEIVRRKTPLLTKIFLILIYD